MECHCLVKLRNGLEVRVDNQYQEISFYLTVFGGSLPLLGHIVSSLRFTFICILFHYMLGLVSKSEVMKRTGKFQAFRECLHNVAPVCYKVHMFFMEVGKEKRGFKPKQRIKRQEKAKTIVYPLRMFAIFCTDIANDRICAEMW